MKKDILKKDIIVIVPARYGSTRFPGKPLAQLGGRPIIEHVLSRVTAAGYNVAVATDDTRIADAARQSGFEAIMTSEHHRSGTDRICEALEKIEATSGRRFEIVINVQGDEPFIAAEQLHLLAACFEDESVDIATLGRPYPAGDGFAGLADPNLVKLVKSPDGRALYFSRSVVPYLRGVECEEWPKRHQYFTHIGVYGYRADVLRAITRLSTSLLEQAESLEQLRWLEAGYSIKVAESESRNIGIDTPADLAAAELFLQQTISADS